MNELRGWVLGYESEMKRVREEKNTPTPASGQRRPRQQKKYYPPRKLKAALKGQLPVQYGAR